jgi:RNA polymerase sigma-70 factor (ECF subfamily)
MTPASKSNDSGQPASLEQLRNAIRAFVLSKVKDPALADDVTQETLIRLHKKSGSLRDADRLHAWVFQIARNAVADHFRAAKPTDPFDERLHAPPTNLTPSETVTAEEETLQQNLAAYVRSVVDLLPDIYREALQLTEFEGKSQVDLARQLGLSTSAAKSRVQRARAMVREQIERCCHWETDRYGKVLDVHPKTPSRCDCDSP